MIEKAASLGFSIVMGHPFVDGNKRTGDAAMETFLVLNGYELSAPVDDGLRPCAARARSRKWGRATEVARQPANPRACPASSK